MSTGFIIEVTPAGRRLVVTGEWTSAAANILRGGDIDALELNYARGFRAIDLDLIEDWPIRELDVLDRSQVDLRPIRRLAARLERLSVQAAPKARLDLDGFAKLTHVAGVWRLVGPSLGPVASITSLVTWQFNEEDLSTLSGFHSLLDLVVKDAPHLQSLQGVSGLRSLRSLRVALARNLHDIRDIAMLAASLTVLELVKCPMLGTLDAIAHLVELTHLEVGDCGPVSSLRPIAGLVNLETLHAWGTTRIVDNEMTPLEGLPRLAELRMRDRREYSPRLSEVRKRLAANGPPSAIT